MAYAPLLGVALVAAWRRAERSWLSDAATVTAACLLAAVAHTPASVPAPPSPAALVGGSVGAWQVVAVLALYFLGTVAYVKTMIRERGNPAVLAVSLAWHVLAAAAGRARADGRRAPGASSRGRSGRLTGLFVLLAAAPRRSRGAGRAPPRWRSASARSRRAPPSRCSWSPPPEGAGQAPKSTCGAWRTSGSVTSKYSARVKENMPAMTFAGKLSTLVFSARTFAL